MQTLTIVLRAIHILAGVAWVGSVFLFVFFIEPTSRAIGPAAAPFMAELVGKRKVIRAILYLGTITILAGAGLYWINIRFVGISAFVGTGPGLSLTLGAVTALAAFTIGMLGTRPAVGKLTAIGKDVAASGGPPSQEQGAAIAALQRRMRIYARTSLALLTFTVLEMAIARS